MIPNEKTNSLTFTHAAQNTDIQKLSLKIEEKENVCKPATIINYFSCCLQASSEKRQLHMLLVLVDFGELSLGCLIYNKTLPRAIHELHLNTLKMLSFNYMNNTAPASTHVNPITNRIVEKLIMPLVNYYQRLQITDVLEKSKVSKNFIEKRRGF